jgi:hypothetical protein
LQDWMSSFCKRLKSSLFAWLTVNYMTAKGPSKL